MPRKAQRDAERTRARILASALALFAKKGYERTTFTDIAARLKMTKGAVYWHFETKQALLMSLVDEMVEMFGRQIAEMMPQGELTFPAVAELMVKDADMVVGSPRMTAFFMLLKCQVRWSDTSMAQVREELLANERFGPLQAFRTAIVGDIAAGRVRANTDAAQVAAVCIAIWDGLVQNRITRFLDCDLTVTLRNAYAAVWNSIKV